jgi:very-short-patch-repair endonuclease
MKQISKGEILMAKHLKELGLLFKQQVRFEPERKWAVDFFLPYCRIAIEIEGNIWGRSRHGWGKGFENDCEKYNAATMAGIRVLRFSTQMVESGRAKAFIKEYL